MTLSTAERPDFNARLAGSARAIALVGYPHRYFSPFADALEVAGFEVSWVHSVRSEAVSHVRSDSTVRGRLLDSTEGFTSALAPSPERMKRLAELETAGGPRINDIILMDRRLRLKSYSFALAYLCHLQDVLESFFRDRGVSLVTSGRDTALQLMGMLVARSMGIRWVVPTRLRIPKDVYMFAAGHNTDELISFRRVEDSDREWARNFLARFSERQVAPALKVSARGVADVVRLLPRHARAFANILARAYADRGNDYSRYTVLDVVRMYLRRRARMLRFKISPPWSQLPPRPFSYYALHTQPESSIDVAGSFFSDQVALIRLIARSLPVGQVLVVKIHPTDVDGQSIRFYQSIAEVPGVVLVNYDADSRTLINDAEVVFTLAGTVGFEAALLARPVVTFAANYYNSFPSVVRCLSPTSLPALIDEICASRPAPCEAAIVETLARLRSMSFDGEVNRMFQATLQPLSDEDLEEIRRAYLLLHDSTLRVGIDWDTEAEPCGR